MTIYDLKPKFQNLLRPIVLIFWRIGLTPNQVTLATCILSMATGLFLLLLPKEIFFILPFFFFFRMALNAVDGMLAKEHGMKTPLGAILNEVTDVLSDGFLYYSFTRVKEINMHLLLFVIFMSAITEVTGLAALLNVRERQYSGPMGKSDRAFVFSMLAIFLSFDLKSAILLNLILGIVAILLILTTINRIKRSLS